MLSLGAVMAATSAQAGMLEERIEEGDTIRLGFAAAPPWAYAGDDGSPQGFVNGIAVDVLERMGHTNIEPVLTDWASLIPSLKAGRVDMVTGGMYVVKARCENMDFSDPIGAFGDTFVVPSGNPKNLETYQDLIDQDLTMVAPSGYNTLADAESAGVPESSITEVPGTTEALAALRTGRTDAVAINVLEAKHAADMDDSFDITDPELFVGREKQVVGIGFRPEDSAFREAFNDALEEYMGSEEMMATVTPDNYLEAFLPGELTTEDACQSD
ncbi:MULTISPECIES: transporter substrate-binding domain-containing protein [unclassified Halomonas]|uniref:transporter substrate-binding domain-containing protein n=1 Tax=unclassified Halomonas TaxID=2609666 RepID=UPI002883FCE8|nr:MULTISPECIES: transporter substrate-binding domain-containing protein [unclassified Halomonas]MDT0499981.1 transporter substrate-binding domain-containing protein [Halomonas sp. PAR7]MDT0512385.1 transporter substrate-binding domain-containing protein [Halomonas sp. LES1]MDT0591019.1 transporter substrate-binding domain-containing protein [Halomonas sp. PAR8]